MGWEAQEEERQGRSEEEGGDERQRIREASRVERFFGQEDVFSFR